MTTGPVAGRGRDEGPTVSDSDDPLWLLAGFLLGSRSEQSQRPPGHRHGNWWHHHDLPPGGWHDHPHGLDGPVRVLAPPDWWLQRQAFWRMARWAAAAVVLALVPHVLAHLAAVVAGIVVARRYDQWRAWDRRAAAPDPDVEVIETRREPPHRT